MKTTMLTLTLLALSCFAIASGLDPWYQQWEGNRSRSGDLLAVAMGDGRKLFARHFYSKADTYFHSGYYPSIFDFKRDFKSNSLGDKIGQRDGSDPNDCAEDILGPPRDWIDKFSRNFFPSRHVHLGQEQEDHVHGPDCEHGHEGDSQGHSAHEHGRRPLEGIQPSPVLDEILPWIRFSASLDPEHVETYLVGAYWLRKEMGKPQEAERFLREGLRAVPHDPSLLFELGRIYNEEKEDTGQARNVWELGLQRWRATEGVKDKSDTFIYAQLLGNLARLEEQEGRPDKALDYLRDLRRVTPYPEFIQKWIDEIRVPQPSTQENRGN